MNDKKPSRLRRSARTRARIRRQEAVRLTVHRTNLHIYAQVVAADGAKILASASTVEKEVRAKHPKGSNKDAAAALGARIAEKAKAAGVTDVAFGRAGVSYNCRVEALQGAVLPGGREHAEP